MYPIHRLAGRYDSERKEKLVVVANVLSKQGLKYIGR